MGALQKKQRKFGRDDLKHINRSHRTGTKKPQRRCRATSKGGGRKKTILFAHFVCPRRKEDKKRERKRDGVMPFNQPPATPDTEEKKKRRPLRAGERHRSDHRVRVEEKKAFSKEKKWGKENLKSQEREKVGRVHMSESRKGGGKSRHRQQGDLAPARGGSKMSHCRCQAREKKNLEGQKRRGRKKTIEASMSREKGGKPEITGLDAKKNKKKSCTTCPHETRPQ